VFMGPGSPPAVRASAGTTVVARRTNLWLYEMMSGSVSLFPACSLQGTAQRQRVVPSVVQSDPCGDACASSSTEPERGEPRCCM
jgi:hypothetical protein